MTIQRENQQLKATYTKPTLSEYGSLAERTRIFGLNPISDLTVAAASVAISGVAVAAL